MGTYRSDFYGGLRVLACGGRLTLVLGRKADLRFAVSHWSGNTWSLHWTGESAYGISAVDFVPGRGNRAGAVKLELLEVAKGLGTFRRR